MGNAQAVDSGAPLVIDPRAGELSLPDTFGESSTDDAPGGVVVAGTSPRRDVVSLPDAFGESSTDDVDDADLGVRDGGEEEVGDAGSCEMVVVEEALLSPPVTILFANDSASNSDSVQEVRDEVDTAPVSVLPKGEPTDDEPLMSKPPKDDILKKGSPEDVILKVELAKVEYSKEELPNVESTKDELPNVESSKDELPTVESSKDELPEVKVEPPKDEFPEVKVEPPKDELPEVKVEPPKDELSKVESSENEIPKVEPSKDELPKVEPSKDELSKVVISKDEPLKNQHPKDVNWEDDEDEEGYLAGVLGKTSDKAEARLAARRQARAEAREIRMRELERQQKEIEESCNKNYDSFTDTGGRTPRSASTIATRSTSLGGSNSYLSSRRSSEDSLEEGISLRDVRHELKEVEEKFRKAMIQNAQLDNEKASLTYEVELFKDRLEDLEEAHAQLQREHRDKGRELDQLKRTTAKLKEDMEWYKEQMEERDRLIQEKGLMIVGDDVSSDDDGSDEPDSNSPKKPRKRALVTVESAELLQSAGEGSLDVRLRRFAEERNELQDQVRHLKLELEEQYSRYKSDARRVSGATMNGPDTEVEDVQREANKLLGEYKFKLQKAEQDVSTLQATVARLESQVIRYKSASESAEKVEDELKVEKRKLQRELRETQSRVEELEVSNSHLQRRLEKLKNAKSALLKEL